MVWWAPLLVVALAAVFFTVFCKTYEFYLKTYGGDSGTVILKRGSKHRWTVVEAFEPGHYCNVCGTGAYRGAQCDSCGIVVDRTCVRGAQKLPCKIMSLNTERLSHQWIQGNLALNSICTVCDEDCGEGPGLRDFRCCWCQRTVHTRCKPSVNPDTCDLGEFKDMIIPPNCVRLKTVGWKGGRYDVVAEVVKPDLENWRPLIVVANRKSGSGEGDLVLRTFRRLLNPAQVLDLADVPPEMGLRWCRLTPPDVRCRILVAGGDGTIGWILSSIEKMRWPNNGQWPDVMPLPLGTGNDLSRVLEWGSGGASEFNGENVLAAMASSILVLLDRWHVSINSGRRLGIQIPIKRMEMSNYASIGVDALVTLNFHRRRYALPRVVSGRFMNKLLFFTYGTKDVLERACRDLSKHVTIRLDDGPMMGINEEKQLPELEGIVILNIPFWGAGVRLYDLSKTSGNRPPQAIDDGKLEVFGLYSSFHIAQLQVGLSEPYWIGQANKVEIFIRGTELPMQIDGEPWTQGPGTVTITRSGQARLLSAASRKVDQHDELTKFFL